VGAHTCRIIPDTHAINQQLQEIHAHPSVTKARRQPSENALEKIIRYLDRFLCNNWVCAAFALDPSNRQDGLEMLWEEYDIDGRSADDVVACIRTRMKPYPTEMEREESEVTVIVR
jgi:hypothetical protein